MSEQNDNLTLLRLLHQCAHKINMSSKYPGQGRLLVLLHKKGTLTQRELIEITQRRSATLSEQLAGMEKSGYITRTKNPLDNRNIDVSLTALGEQAAVEAEQAIHQKQQRDIQNTFAEHGADHRRLKFSHRLELDNHGIAYRHHRHGCHHTP